MAEDINRANSIKIIEALFEKTGLVLDEETKHFLETAGLNQTGITSWAIASSAIYSSKLTERALSQHSEALIKAAKASEKHAASLKWATWVLAGATVLLAVITAVNWYYQFFLTK